MHSQAEPGNESLSQIRYDQKIRGRKFDTMETGVSVKKRRLRRVGMGGGFA